VKRLVGPLFVALLLLGAALPGTAIAASTQTASSASHWPHTITLPGATSAEGIARGRGNTFYAGDLVQGDIYRGNVRTGKVSLFIDAPAGRFAAGMKADLRHNLLFVAGGPTGQAYVYDLKSGATVASFQLGTAPSTFVNDVVVTGGFAYFTDSVQPHLYRIPIHRNGTVGTASQLALTGPAANITGAFNVNGIAAAPGGKYLILSHSTDGTLYRVNRKTGASVAIAGATLPNVDGILLDGHRIWAVQNTNNQITELRLSRWFTKATVRKVITDSAFETPTAVAKFGHRLAVVNAKFDTGFPPTATSFEVVVVKR
jgi:sugar lactone lactonase YvrE